MSYIFVVIICVVLAVAIRFLISRNDKLKNSNLCTYIKFLVYFVMMVILAYYVTDIYEGLIRVALSICFYGVIFYVSNQKKDEMIIHIMIVVVLPMYFIFMSDATYYLLVNLSTLFLPIAIISGLMFAGVSELNEFNWNGTIAVVIGLLIAFSFFPLVNESSYIEDSAIKYAEEQLGIELGYIYASHGFRDESIIIKGFSSFDESKVTMVYRNGSIISSEIEEIE